MITYPKDLPTPLLQSVIQAQDTQYVTEFDTGYRFRKKTNWGKPVTEVQLQIVIDEKDLPLWYNFMKDTSNGTDYFLADWSIFGYHETNLYHFTKYPQIKRNQNAKQFFIDFSVQIDEYYPNKDI